MYLRDGVPMISQKAPRQPFSAKVLANNKHCLVQIPSATKKQMRFSLEYVLAQCEQLQTMECSLSRLFIISVHASIRTKAP